MNKETLEEASEQYFKSKELVGYTYEVRDGFIDGAKYQAEKMYTEEEVHSIVSSYYAHLPLFKPEFPYGKWFEQFKKK